MSTRYGRFLPVLIALVAVACAGPSTTTPDPRIENLDLDIQLTAIPDGLVVADNPDLCAVGGPGRAVHTSWSRS